MKKLLKLVYDNSNVSIMTTDAYHQLLRKNNTTIDFLFIDADHSKEQVKKDFINYFDLVSDHGIIILHDTHPASIEYVNPKACGDAYSIVMELQREFLDRA